MKHKHRGEKMSSAGRWILSKEGEEALRKLSIKKRHRRSLAKKKIEA